MLGSPPLVDAAAAATVATKITRPNRAMRRTCSSLSRVTGVVTSPRRLRIALIAALALTVAVVAAGWGAKSSVAGARHATSSVTVKTRKIAKLGTVLVNSRA